MAAGAIDFYRSGREVDGSGGLRTEWVRATTFGDVRAALIEFATGAVVESPLAAYFGGEPDPIVVGTLDERLAVTAVSNEVERLLGRRPEDLIGVQIVEDHDAEAVNDLLDGIAGDDLPTVARLVHVADARGEPHRLCLMIVPSVGTKRCFLLVDDPELPSAAPGGEAARLEQVLRNIATELSNSGLLRDIQPSVVPVLPETQGLSRRQWEILSRLVRGERVPSIATELYVSQSTVRNHLTVIFRRFGVHSQAELLARLRDAATPG
jgi:DNA-binding CsgD family transcriptional regulator